jgi:CheY-like chemotaxis protein
MGQMAATVVLVVEDDALIRMNAVCIAEESGVAVLEAANADEAIAILEARSDIRIVFTDIQMPGSIDGLRLAHAVRDRWPPIQFIITSGKVLADASDMPDGSVFLCKPYDAKDVIGAIHRFANSSWESVPPCRPN